MLIRGGGVETEGSLVDEKVLSWFTFDVLVLIMPKVESKYIQSGCIHVFLFIHLL